MNINDVPGVNVTPKISNDSVTYAAAMAPGDPSQNYVNAKTDVATTGTSDLVTQQETQWKVEQALNHKNTVEDIISDPTVPLAQRQEAMRNYVSGSVPLQTLRDKFMIQTAINDMSPSPVDQEAQTSYAEQLAARDANQKRSLAKSFAPSGYEMLSGVLKDTVGGTARAAGFLTTSLIASIPAGIAAAYAAIKHNDAEAGEAIDHKIMSLVPKTKDEFAQEVIGIISKEMDTAFVAPFRWMGQHLQDAILETSRQNEAELRAQGDPNPSKFRAYDDKLSALLGAATETVGQFIGPAVAVKTVSKAGEAATAVINNKFNTAFKDFNVSPTSPMDTIATASKATAAKVAANAITTSNSTMLSALNTTKDRLVQTYVLPKVKDEYTGILPDARREIENLIDAPLADQYNLTEFNPSVTDGSLRIGEREQYLKVLTETAKPHLLLSSSILDIPAEAQLFGRTGKDYEAYITSGVKNLEGTAVFGRNSNFGYKTVANAEKYMAKLVEQTQHLPEPGEFKVISRDGQHYVQWDFKRQYNPWEYLTMGAESISAHLFSKTIDVTGFANSTLGKWLWPNYMRMDQNIPAMGGIAAWKEGNITKTFLQASRDTFLNSEHKPELVNMLQKGEEEGRTLTLNDVKSLNQHLTSAQADHLYASYSAFRRITDHLYRFADRTFRKKLLQADMKAMYDEKGIFAGYTSEPLKPSDIPDSVTKVWDLKTKSPVELDTSHSIIRLKAPVRNGKNIFHYADMPETYQHGPIRAGSLTKIPGYIPRNYKEWFVIDKEPKDLWVDGVKAGKEKVPQYRESVAMAGTKAEAEALHEKFSAEDAENTYHLRVEQKNIEDKIIFDSKIYDTYTKEVHKRGESLPTLNGRARVQDPLVSLTKAIRSVSRATAWEDLQAARKATWVKSFGKFTNGQFPRQINEIKISNYTNHPNAADERAFLAAHSIYEQFEREQVQSVLSDEIWNKQFNNFADIFEKFNVDASVMREWGEKGFVPIRAVKASASHIWLYWRFLRELILQPQQWKELGVVDPSYLKSIHEVLPILGGLSGKTHTFKGLASHFDSWGRKIMPDYDEVIKALSESGIMQAVDMNQMIHGMWRSATEELVPSKATSTLGVVNKGLHAGTKTTALPGRIGRTIGYDQGELVNQITIWLFARNRWIKEHPDMNWNTPEALAQIAQKQWVIGHASSTRAGMFKWQEGTLGTLSQFAAIPWKAFMQMVGSHEFSGLEKARLAAGRMAIYGKYGIPYGAALYALLERNISNEEDRQKLAGWSGGLEDVVVNGMLQAMFDSEGQSHPTSVEASKSLSTVNNSVWQLDVIQTLYQIGAGEKPDQRFPFITASSSIFQAAQTVHDIFKVKDLSDPAALQAATWKMVSFAGILSDVDKAMGAQGIYSRMGVDSGYDQTAGEAVAKLFGIQDSESIHNYEALKSKQDRQKEVKNTAINIHQRLIQVINATTPDEKMRQEAYFDGLQSFLTMVPDYYRDEVIQEVMKLDRMTFINRKESIAMYIYKHYQDLNDNNVIDMERAMEKSNDPEMKSLLKDLETYRKERQK
jgi:hypothetical protein